MNLRLEMNLSLSAPLALTVTSNGNKRGDARHLLFDQPRRADAFFGM
jgi:hypothetical protein